MSHPAKEIPCSNYNLWIQVKDDGSILLSTPGCPGEQITIPAERILEVAKFMLEQCVRGII